MRRSWRFQPWGIVPGTRSGAGRARGRGGASEAAVLGPGLAARLGQDREALREADAGVQRAACSGVSGPGQPHRVLALDAEARMEHALGPVAVVGEQEQPLGVLVQAPDRVQPRTPGEPVGMSSRTVVAACRSRVVEVTPAGLWSAT